MRGTLPRWPRVRPQTKQIVRRIYTFESFWVPVSLRLSSPLAGMGDEMAYRYNPESEVPAEFWLSLDESERIRMVEDYHRRARIKLPNRRVHAALHAVVETQIAMGDETEAQATLTRLLSEGLDRHDAIHAIADVLAEHMVYLQKGQVAGNPNETYSKRLRHLTASKWLEKWKPTNPST